MTIRSIDDAFWGWDDVQELSANAKLLYLYAWTNKHSNIAACYHATKRTISFETGLTVAQIDKAFNELESKVVYTVDGFLWVKNFIRRQRGSSGEKLLKAVNGILKHLPPHISSIVYEYNMDNLSWTDYVEDYAGNDNLSITYAYPTDRLTDTDTDTESSSSYKRKVDFNTFYDQYPRKGNKEKSRLAWNKLSASVQSKAMLSLPAFTESMQNREEEYIALASTWINGKRWEDLDVEEITCQTCGDTGFFGDGFCKECEKGLTSYEEHFGEKRNNV